MTDHPTIAQFTPSRCASTHKATPGSPSPAYNRLWRDIIEDNCDRTESSEDLKAEALKTRRPKEGECFLTIDELRARYAARLAARRVAA